MLQSVGLQRVGHDLVTEQQPQRDGNRGRGLANPRLYSAHTGRFFPLPSMCRHFHLLPDQTSLRQLEDSPSGHPTGRWGCGGPQALPPSPTVPSPAPRAHVSSGLQSCGAGQTALPPAGRGASVQSDSFLSSSRLAPSFILPHSHPFPAFHGLGAKAKCVCTCACSSAVKPCALAYLFREAEEVEVLPVLTISS